MTLDTTSQLCVQEHLPQDRNQPKRDRAEYMREYRKRRKPSPGELPGLVHFDEHDQDDLVNSSWFGVDGPRQNREPLVYLPTHDRPPARRKCALQLLCNPPRPLMPHQPFCKDCYRYIKANGWDKRVVSDKPKDKGKLVYEQAWLQAAVEETLQEFAQDRRDERHGLSNL